MKFFASLHIKAFLARILLEMEMWDTVSVAAAAAAATVANELTMCEARKSIQDLSHFCVLSVIANMLITRARCPTFFPPVEINEWMLTIYYNLQ